MTVANRLLLMTTFFISAIGGVSSQDGNETVPECVFNPRRLTETTLYKMNDVPLPTKSTAIVIKRATEIGCILRVSQFVLQPVDRQLLVYFLACKATHPVILDTENVTTLPDNIAYLQVENCSINGADILKLEQLYDLKVLSYFGTVPTDQMWLGKKSMSTNVSKMSEVVAYTISTNAYSNDRPWILEANETFPNIAELSLTGIGLTELPPDMSVRFPNLQSIELDSNRFTQVPVFPYTEKPFFLPANLSRTSNMQHHYVKSIGINIRSDIFRRIFVLNNNFIKSLDDYFVDGTLQLISLNGNGLSNISDRAFDRVIGLQALVLRNNTLVAINDKVFSKCTELLHLELAQNNINWIHSDAFRKLSKLKELSLSANNLATINTGTFYGLSSLHTLKLDKNNISNFDHTVLPISSVKVRIVNLSQNKFQTLPVLFFLIRELEMVDLSQCEISIDKMSDLLDLIPDTDLIDSVISSASRPQQDIYAKREKKRTVNLKHNFIRRLDFTGLLSTHKKKIIIILNNFELILTNNPIECDCHLVPLLDFFAKARSENQFDGKEYFYTKWLCHSPPEFQERPLLSLQKTDLYCREQMPGCPSGCICYRRHVSRIVIVNCSRNNLISFPAEMPDGRLEIWLQYNNISEIASRSYLPRIEILKMTRNLLTSLSVSVLKQMKSIRKLYLDSNLLTTLPKEVEEVNFDLLVIDMNHLLCDCHNEWMKKWLLTVQNRVQDWHKIACSTSEDKVFSIIKVNDDDFICTEEINFKKTLALGLSLGFAILLVLICLYLLFYYRLEVKVLIYIYFNLHPFDCDPQKIDDAKEPIDTLVICSKSMIGWVAENVTDALESLRFNVIDINRDFLIGMSVRENMRIAVCRSKRSLVILSMDSFSDPIVQLALRFTHEKVLRERPTYMVLFLHEVEKSVIDNQELKKYLSGGRYIRTGDSMLKQKMLYLLTGSNEANKQGMELRRKKSYKIFFPEIMDTSCSPSTCVVYDIFISYPDRDYQFATGVLFPALHGRGYRVCLPDRDFRVGGAKEENILNAIDQSRRTLVIVTENHVDDEWQLFTLRTAIERSLKETSNYLLCMLDPKVDLDSLDPETRAFLSTHVIIFQDDPLFWQKFYRSIPPPAFKKPDPDDSTYANGPLTNGPLTNEPLTNGPLTNMTPKATDTPKTVYSIT